MEFMKYTFREMTFLLTILLVFISACEHIDSKITSYPALCKGKVNNGVCSGKILRLNRSIYKVSVKRQEVIHWMPNVFEEPQKITDCIIRDRNNWVCKYSDGSGGIKVIRGKFEDSKQGKTSGGIFFYLPWWHWWFINLSQ